MSTKTACVDTELAIFDLAKSILAKAVEHLASESISLLDASGRIAAEDIVAEEDLVLYARSAMDGYALRAADTLSASPGSPLGLPVVGRPSRVKGGQHSPLGLRSALQRALLFPSMRMR